MSVKKSPEKVKDLINLPILNEDLPLQVLLQRVNSVDTVRRERTVEQKIIALKILILNKMQYSATAKQVGVDRKTLYKWWGDYGEMMQKTNPDQAIIQTVENDVAIARADALSEWYGLLDDSAKILRTLVKGASGTRNIYPVVEAVKAATEVIKTEKEVSNANGIKGESYYMNIFNTIVENQYGKDGNKG